MGSRKELIKIIKTIIKANINVALSIQIREENYYTNKENLLLSAQDYIEAQKLCSKANLKLGFAIGEINDLNFFKKNKIKPSFIKVLSMATKKKTFIKKVQNNFRCPIFYSTGHSTVQYISKYILPLMKSTDYLIHTSFSSQVVNQNFKKMIAIKSLHKNVSYGLHCHQKFPVFTAIGCGAKKIFLYIGNKKLNLMDNLHALDIKEIKSFYKLCDDCIQSI